MTFATLAARGLDIALKKSLLGETFTLRGASYTGIIDDVNASEFFAPGGAIPSEPISVTFKKRTFSPVLNLGERITCRSRNYTVRMITTDEISVTLIAEHLDKR